MFLMPGWQHFRKELLARQSLAAKALIFGSERERDQERREAIRAIEFILDMENSLFTLPAPPEQREIETPADGNRYSV